MKRLPLALLLAGLGLVLSAPLVLAGGWWSQSGGPALSLTQVASNPVGGWTLVLTAAGRTAWYRAATGQFDPFRASPERPVAVAAVGGTGVVAFSNGTLARVSHGGPSRWLGRVPPPVQGLALGGTGEAQLAVASRAGLYFGRLGRHLRRRMAGDATAVLAPPRGGLPWMASVGGRIVLGDGSSFHAAPGAPPVPQGSRIAELGIGTQLVAQPSGTVWADPGGRWQAVFQLLPYGGIGGIPVITALASDGPQAAYLATRGFGTLLTPDAGFSWYRTAPSSSVLALATLGPVFAARPHGEVIAAAPHRVFLHRLQTLPAPPVYSGGTGLAEALGTAGVAVLFGVAVAGLLWLDRRRGRRLFV